MTDCPSDDTLREYLDDSIPADSAGAITGHIDGCPQCQTRLDGLTSESGRLASRLKQAAANSGTFPAAEPPFAGPDQPTYLFDDTVVPIAPRVVPRALPTIPGYAVHEEIGRGGMGVVYKATHKRLNRLAAVKMVLAGGLADPRVTQRFLFEAETLGRISHPQVVQVYEVSMYAAPTGVTIPFLAMEYLDGGTLGEWSNGQPQPPKVAAELVEGLARAVQAAHVQGVIHRDLKPANILRAADGTFKVTDFGLAKLTADTSDGLTGSGTVLGTPAYMAPEQASGEKGIGPPADIYSLGSILFELLTGRPPFDGGEPMSVLLKVLRDPAPDVRAVRRDVPRDLAAVVANCLTKEPHRRYASAAELADDLKRFRDGRPTRARSHATAERLWYWSKRNPGTAALLAALTMVMASAFVSVLILWRRAEGNALAMTAARDTSRRQFDEAERQRDEAAKQRRTADRQGAYLAFDQAVHLCESGQLDDGLRGFVRALELAEGIGEAGLARVARVNIAAWDRELFPAGTQFQHSASAPLAASGFSPDGQWVFTAGTDNRVVIWDGDSGRRVAELTNAAAGDLKAIAAEMPFAKQWIDVPSIRAVAISRDRTRVAAAVSSGRIAVWSPTNAKPLRAFPVVVGTTAAKDLWAAEFDGEGRLWVGGDGGILARIDVETGTVVESLTLPPLGKEPTSVQSLRLSPEGKTLWTGDRVGRLLEWDLATGTSSSTTVGGWVGDIGLTPTGDGVAVASTAGAGVVRSRDERGWDVPTNGAYATAAQFAAGGRLLVVGDEDGKAQVWDTVTQSPVGGPLRIGVFAKRISVRPGRAEILVPKDRGVRLQPVASPRSVRVEVLNHIARVRVLDFAPDGKRLLVGSGPLSIHDSSTGRLLSLVSRETEALGGRFIAGGTRVIYGHRTGWRVTDGAGGGPVRVGSGHYVSLFPTGPNHEILPCVGLDRQFQRLSADGMTAVSTVSPNGIDFRESPPAAACVAPEGREIRFATKDRVHFHDLDTGAANRPPITAVDEIRALAQTPDGKLLVLGLRDNTVQVWDVVAGSGRPTERGRHERAVTSLAVSPDGKTILSGSRDQTARFWDVETGLALGPRLRHAQAVTAVAYSPNGDRVATGTSQGRAVAWPVPPQENADDRYTLRERYDRLRGNSQPPLATHD